MTTATEPPEAQTDKLSERTKAGATVPEFVSQYDDLRPTVSGAIGLCRFHFDHHPSLGVNEEENYWHFITGCGGESVIDFWMKWKGCEFAAAVN
ncbi:MAG: CHC2 zinc finger domain-containing protein [Anaerolineae bacterium]